MGQISYIVLSCCLSLFPLGEASKTFSTVREIKLKSLVTAVLLEKNNVAILQGVIQNALSQN